MTTTTNKDIRTQLTEIDNEIESIDKRIRELKNRRTILCERKLQLEKALSRNVTRLDDQSSINDVWSSESFDWSPQLREKLRSIFRLDDFREFQLAAMNATLSGEDLLLVMATGGGKSLCFQLPALISSGYTLVVSPLISLMEDQIMALKKLGVPAAMLSQNTTKDELNHVQNAMVDSKADPILKLLFVTPEKLAKSKRFMAKVQKSFELKRLQRIAIDEVHCCSQWGHDFRPDYKFLNILRRQFPGVPILGLTATATERVLTDVKDILCIPAALTFRANFNRPNLYYEVRNVSGGSSVSDVHEDLYKLLNSKFKDQSGIIYCFSKKETEELTAFLKSRKVKAEFYHADLPADVRSRVHSDWHSANCRVIIATIAFGMGIDKPDVRFVVHCSMSKSLESYYQESGRAGRDGRPAVCLLYYRFADIFRQSSMVCTEKLGVDMLYAMVRYCHSVSNCRRQIIAEYFNEPWDPTWCQQKCDVCHNDGSATDSNNSRTVNDEIMNSVNGQQYQKMLSILADSEQKMTGLKLSDSLIKKTKMSKSVCDRMIVECLLNKVLKQDFHFTPYNIICYLVLGPKANFLSTDRSDEEETVKKRRKLDDK